MGYLRVLLALMVVFTHRGPFSCPACVLQGGATFAVKAFFVVSGFYMALVISDRYRNLPVWDFYASRLMRLLPIYWVVGGMALLAEFVLVAPGNMFYALASPLFYWAGPNGLHLAGIPAILWAYIGISEVTLLGADSWLWLGFSRIDGTLSLAPGYGPNATSGNALSPVPQAWTIGLELWFYLIAPFVVRRFWLVLLLAGASLLSRYVMHRLGFSGEPWSRAFFPSELIYFLLGVVAHRIYVRFPAFRFPHNREAIYVTATLLIFFAMAPATKALSYLKGEGIAAVPGDLVNLLAILLEIVPYVALVAVLPCLFGATKDSVRDNRIGDLSYPIYMCHTFVYGLLAAIPINFSLYLGSGWFLALFNAALVIGVAVALDRWVAQPVDWYRRRFGARAHTTADASSTAA